MRHYGKYRLDPLEVPRLETGHRRIVTPLPVPESVPVLERLMRHEPRSMHCMPPVLWDHARGYQVHDRFGNTWIDWSSCVLVANAGHAPPAVEARLRRLLDRSHLATYVFAHEERAELVARLAELSPAPLEKVFLLTTGSEAVECAIKLLRAHGRAQDPDRRVIVSFTGAFHGRTLGSQRTGGIAAQKEWIGDRDPSFVQVPFPDGWLQEDTSFAVFERALEEQGVDPRHVAGVVSETYQGIGPDFLPETYARELRSWCDRNGALLCFDEVQAGFGRTGRLWAFEHYGVVPDVVACGKGISSSLPLAAVIGRADVLDRFPSGSMTSTHSGSPMSCAAGLGSLDALESDGLVERAAALEPDLAAGCERIRAGFPDVVGCWRARGLVGGIRVVRPGTREPASDLAFAVTEACFRRGLLLFSPVGLGGGCLKIAPPLCTPRDALMEGFDVLEEAFREVCRERE